MTKISDMIANWTAHACGAVGGPPLSIRREEEWLVGVNLCGPDLDGDLLLVLTEGEDERLCYIPVAVLANHLRLAGWTVTPPEAK